MILSESELSFSIRPGSSPRRHVCERDTSGSMRRLSFAEYFRKSRCTDVVKNCSPSIPAPHFSPYVKEFRIKDFQRKNAAPAVFTKRSRAVRGNLHNSSETTLGLDYMQVAASSSL